MRYIKFFGDAGFSGTSYEEVYAYPDDTDDADIDEISTDMARDHAESFEYLETGWGNDFEDDEHREAYYESALENCGWEEISETEYNKWY